MSKLSFRARALDASKPMPIYYTEEVPDLHDFAAINRAVPQMPTGMEKEEECEHHLQRVISAQQAFGRNSELVIPTPEVYATPKEIFEQLYPATYKNSRQLIHVQPFSMDQDIPDYDMDTDDEKWLNQQAKKMDICPLQFEEMMDRLEKSSGQQVITLKEAKLLLKEDDDLIIAVYDYWLNKRLRTQHPLIPQVKTEKRDGSTNNNPYVAFRRRTEKMQTRKNRKNDETSYEKMLKLRRDLSRAVTLLEMVKRREKTKREQLHLTIEIFEKRYQAGDFSGQILAEVSAIKHPRPTFIPVNNNQVVIKQETRVSKNRQIKSAPRKKREYKRKNKQDNLPRPTASNSHLQDIGYGDIGSSEDDGFSPAASDQEDENDPDGPYAFRRKKFCNYHAPLIDRLGNWPWCSTEEGGLGDKRYRYCLTALPSEKPRCIGFARRRIGRGGRVLMDRAWTPLDDCWSQLDINTLPSLPNGLPSSNELITEIRNEWLYFRPQPRVNIPNSENTEDTHPEEHRNTEGGNRSVPHIPMELDLRSFQNHQEELFELQRKQLERLKEDEPCPVSSSRTEHSFFTQPTSRFKLESSSSVDFSLSAVISASEECSSQNSLLTPPTALNPLENSITSGSIDRVVLTNGPVSDRAEIGYGSNNSIVERCGIKDYLASNSLDSIVNTTYSPNSSAQVTLCLPAVPSAEDGSGTASHSSDSVHVINTKTSTPQTELRFSSVEQNGNEVRIKKEVFLNKVKVEKVSSDSAVSMDVT